MKLLNKFLLTKFTWNIVTYFTWISCETRFTCNSREIYHMNFTWNEVHLKFTWQFHVKFTWNKFHVKFMWNSRETFTWNSHEAILPVLAHSIFFYWKGDTFISTFARLGELKSHYPEIPFLMLTPLCTPQVLKLVTSKI